MVESNLTELDEWYTIAEHLVGVVKGHKYIPDGRLAFTTRLSAYDRERDAFVTESGTHYQLGDQHSISKRVYPNLKEQLVYRLLKVESEGRKVERTIPLQ